MTRPPTRPIPEIIAALRVAGGNIAAAARALGTSRSALHSLIGRRPELARVVAQAGRGHRRHCPSCHGRGRWYECGRCRRRRHE